MAAIGTDEIAVGLIYTPGTVAPVGAAAILDSAVYALFDDTKKRLPLVLTQGYNQVRVPLPDVRFLVAAPRTQRRT